MLNLEMLDTEVSAIFAPAENGGTITVPEPPLMFKQQIEAYDANDLTQQYVDTVHQMRCWQLEKLGFTKVDVAQIAEAIMGKPHTHYWDGEKEKDRPELERQVHEWMYNHLSGTTLAGKDSTWGSRPTQWYRIERVAPFWWLPPFMAKEVWRIQYGKLNYIKKQIPVEIAARLQYAKKLGLFNAFTAVAPMAAWTEDSKSDPVLLGCVWPFNPAQNKSDAESFYYLGRW